MAVAEDYYYYCYKQQELLLVDMEANCYHAVARKTLGKWSERENDLEGEGRVNGCICLSSVLSLFWILGKKDSFCIPLFLVPLCMR